VTDITPLDATPIVAFEPTEHKPTRETIERLEAAMLQMPQVHVEIKHYLSGQIYARHADIPEGMTVTGCVHRKDHICVLDGDVTVWTDQGMKRLTGYHVLPSSAGTKRAVYTHAQTRWTTLIHTEMTTLEDIEADMVEKPEALLSRKEIAGPQTLIMLEKLE
jgi:hypothetical protein